MTVLFDSIRKNIISTLLMFLTLMGVYHLVFSKTGLLIHYAMQGRVEETQDNYYAIRDLRFKKEHKVSLLKTNNLDLDMLEEQARLQFNVRTIGERVLVIE